MAITKTTSPQSDDKRSGAQGGHAGTALLVDDDRLMLDFLRIALHQRGWVTHQAETVSAAKEIFGDHPEITVIVSDIQMPSETGFDLADWLNNTTRDDTHAELILITGDATNDALIAALRSRVSDFLKKPFHVRTLLEAVERAHRTAQSRRERTQRLAALAGALQRVQDERRAFEARLEQAEVRFADTNARLIDVSQTMVNIVSHELRTPLIPIIGLAELLETAEDLSVQETREYAGEIRRAGENLAHIVENAMHFIDIERQVRERAREWVVLGTLLDDILAELAEQIDGKALNVALSGDRAHKVFLPPDLLRNVLLSLLDNAVKASPDGGTIAVEIMPDDTGGVVIDLRDQGPGLPDRVLRNFGAPFLHGDISDTRTWPGIGLGIASAVRITEACGGSVRPHSTAQGLQMRVILPPSQV